MIQVTKMSKIKLDSFFITTRIILQYVLVPISFGLFVIIALLIFSSGICPQAQITKALADIVAY
jgi:hypothetical protein